MAFTGKTHKGSKVLTPETVVNHDKLYKLLNEIKEESTEEYEKLKSSMFEQMFYHLSHSAQKEMLDWTNKVNWRVCVMKEPSWIDK